MVTRFNIYNRILAFETKDSSLERIKRNVLFFIGVAEDVPIARREGTRRRPWWSQPYRRMSIFPGGGGGVGWCDDGVSEGGDCSGDIPLMSFKNEDSDLFRRRCDLSSKGADHLLANLLRCWRRLMIIITHRKAYFFFGSFFRSFLLRLLKLSRTSETFRYITNFKTRVVVSFKELNAAF